MTKMSIAIGVPPLLVALLACQPVTTAMPNTQEIGETTGPERSPAATITAAVMATETIVPTLTTASESGGDRISLVEAPEYENTITYGSFYVEPQDAPEGQVIGGLVREGWVVEVLGQSQDGIFVQARFVEIPPGLDERNEGLSGWFYSGWLGQGMPLLPAQYTVLQLPDAPFFATAREDFFNWTLESISATQRASGTDNPFLAVEPLYATQTAWAVLQTPQP